MHNRYYLKSDRRQTYRIAENDTALDMVRRFYKRHQVQVTTDVSLELSTLFNGLPDPETILTIVQMEQNEAYACGYGARAEWTVNGTTFSTPWLGVNWFIPLDAIELPRAS